MCHTLLQHYIHCRHTNIHFYHCHVDTDPKYSWSSSLFGSLSSKPRYRCTHPNYRPQPTFEVGDDDPAAWRSHDVPVGVAHSYLRKCPSCVRGEIRKIMDDEEHREGLRLEAVQRWQDYAASSAEEGSPESGERGDGEGLENEADIQDDEDMMDTDENSTTGSDDGQLVDNIDRQLLEDAMRAVRNAERRRRMASDEGGRSEQRMMLPGSARNVSNAVRAGEQRALVRRRSRTRSPPRPRRVADDSTRLGPRVRRRQAQMDIMARARLAEQRIWEQDGGGRLTEQQRALVFHAQPLMATIPEELRGNVARELAEYQLTTPGVVPLQNDGGGIRRTWIDGAADEADAESYVGSRRTYRHMDAVMTETERTSSPSAATEYRTRSARIRFMDAGGSGDQSVDDASTPPSNHFSPETDEDVEVAHSHTEEFSSEAESNTQDAAQSPTQQRIPIVRNTDLYDFPVWRNADDNREAWELMQVVEEGEIKNLPKTSDPSSQRVSPDLSSPASGCPCHRPGRWTTICNAPTHLAIQPHSETLAEQRDSPSHRNLRLPQATDSETLTHDTWEVGVEFQECGHFVAVFVERMHYTNAADIRASCGCYGFDRCLVAHRKASSKQKCLVCRMEKQRMEWSREAGRGQDERCPWFETWARNIRTKRDWLLWPYGARRSQSEYEDLDAD